MVAPLDLLAYLPSPPLGLDESTFKVLNGELLAYASATAIVIVDIRCMRQASSLMGPHSGAVTALEWHPVCTLPLAEANFTATNSSLLLASGDIDGRVIVWDVLDGTPIAALEDAYWSGFGSAGSPAPSRERHEGPPVRGLAWATAKALLAVLLSPGYLLLWDHRTGSVVWRRDLGAADVYSSLKVDPGDRRRLILSSPNAGVFATLRLDAPSADKVRFQRFQADIPSGSSLRCSLPGTRDLVYLLLPKEFIVFDLEYGQALGSTGAPSTMPAFAEMIGMFGHDTAGMASHSALGIDAIYCSHVGGSVSVWHRREGLLTYALVGHMQLAPQAVSTNAGVTLGGHSTPSTSSKHPLLALTATTHIALEQGGYAFWDEDVDPSSSVPPGTVLTSSQGESIPPHPGRVLPAIGEMYSRKRELDAARTPKHDTEQYVTSLPPVIVLALSNEGDLWRWHLPLLAGTLKDTPSSGILLSSVEPSRGSRSSQTTRKFAELLGCLHCLAGRMTACAPFTSPVLVPSMPGGNDAVVGVAVAGTSAGTLEILNVHYGRWRHLSPQLFVAASTCLSPHPSAVLDVRWMGDSPRVVSFSSRKGSSTSGPGVSNSWSFFNTVLLTDCRSGASYALGSGGGAPASEKAPLVAIRPSITGAYLLLVFQGAPSEVWATPEGAPPVRLRQVDLPFTAVEWMSSESLDHEESSSQQKNRTALVSQWTVSSTITKLPDKNSQLSGLPPASDTLTIVESRPEERLAFALADGRLGVLAVRGRRIADTKPRMPDWAPLASGEYHATAAAVFGSLMLLGDAEGVLACWDTASGRTTVVEAEGGRVRALSILPVEIPQSRGGIKVAAYVAVLTSSGAFTVLVLSDQSRGGLSDVWTLQAHPSVTWAAGGARVGRALAVEWMQLPNRHDIRRKNVAHLVVTTESGSLALVGVDLVTPPETRGRPTEAQQFSQLLHLAPSPPFTSPLLLPGLHRQLLRILIQRGIPPALFRDVCDPLIPEEKVEAGILCWLPPRCVAALSMIREEFALKERPDRTTSDERAVLELLRCSSHGEEFDQDTGSPRISQQERQAIEEAAMKLGYRVSASPASGGLVPASGSEAAMQAVMAMGSSMKDLALDVAAATVVGTKPRLSNRPLPEGLQQRASLRAFNSVGTDAALGSPSSNRTTKESTIKDLLLACSEARGTASPLTTAEFAAYATAYADVECPIARRMEVAAAFSGSPEEAEFWRRIPTTLSHLAANSSNDHKIFGNLDGSASQYLPLWSAEGETASAAERSGWHARLGRRIFDASESLQERRVLDFVALGDLQGAVGFLLASPPELSSRFYRDALCTLGMAFACGLQRTTEGEPAEAVVDAAARSLFVQAAKVVSANAASVGDSLLGVPLMCCTGDYHDAVSILQDGGLWSHAAALAASSLRGEARANALERWAFHISQAEGKLWAAVSLLIGIGAIESALEMLLHAGMAGAAAAVLEAAEACGAPVPEEGEEGKALRLRINEAFEAHIVRILRNGVK